MLHPREVGVACGRDAILSVRGVVIHPEVRLFYIEVWVGHVNGGQAPSSGVGFLAVDQDLPHMVPYP